MEEGAAPKPASVKKAGSLRLNDATDEPAGAPGVSSEMPKLIYFAERNPAFTPAGFIRRWRQHAALGISMPRWINIDRYVHCDPVPMEEPGLALLPCDGVAIVRYRSETARLRHVSDSSAREVMRRDEAETFARPVRAFSVLTEEIAMSDKGADEFRLFLALRRRGTEARAEFLDWWRSDQGPRMLGALAALEGCGYRQNHARPEADQAGLGFDVDCVDEIAFTERQAPAIIERIRRVFDLPEVAERADVRAVLTRRTVLHPSTG